MDTRADIERAKRRAEYEALMDAKPCEACLHAEHKSATGRYLPITDDHVHCKRCDWAGSGSLLHTCKTGWREPICGRCNAAILKMQAPAP